MNPLTGQVFPIRIAPLMLAAAPPRRRCRTPGADPVDTLWSVLVSGGYFMFPLAGLLFLSPRC